MMGLSGTFITTVDAEAIAANVPVRVFCMHIISGGGGGGIVSLKNGGSGGTAFITQTGTTSTGATFNYEGGVLFPKGCYIDLDTNTASVTLNCVKES